MRKTRILLVSEAHYLCTGYSIISERNLRALHTVPEFDVAEFAIYGTIDNQEAKKCPWKFYANAVENSDPRIKDYNSHDLNKFGQWRIDRVLIDFKPDVLILLRDAYMDGTIMQSPGLKYCHTIMHVPVDSSPQRNEWLEMYQRADSIFTYSKYGLNILKKECPKANLVGYLGAGVDTTVFKRLDRLSIRQKYNISDDVTIIGTVMRNQIRKLYPDLIGAFSEFRNKLTLDERNKTYLYLHTANPDISGWNITSLIHEYKVANHVMTTYSCKVCKHVFTTVWQDAITICPRCNGLTALHPNVQNGISREQLNEIYNLFDLYIQPAVCEGQGFPPMEAAAAGCPIACTDFSALGDYLDNLGGYRMKVLKEERDLANDAYRSIADRKSMVQTMLDFVEIQGPQSTELKKVIEHYSWDTINNKLINYIKSLPLSDRWETESYVAHPVPTTFQQGMSNSQFLDFIYDRVMVGHNRYSYTAKNIEFDLSLGMTIGNGKKMASFDQQRVFDYYRGLALREQIFEKVRLGVSETYTEDWLDFANRKKV